MSLSEWLDTVVAEKAAEAKPVLVGGSDLKTEPPRSRPVPPLGFDDDRPAARPSGQSRHREPSYREPSYREPGYGEPRGRLPRDRANPYDDIDMTHDRPSRRAPRLGDVEIMLEETLDDVERRVAKAQRRTDLALADLADLIKASDTQRQASQTVFSQVADRLKSIESELAASRARTAEETAGRVKTEVAAMPAAALAAAEQMQRLEAKLNSVLLAVATPKPERLPPKAHVAGEILREAVDEIADRQRDLGETRGMGPLAARLNQRRSAPVGGISDTALALAQMQRDIAGLSAKMDEVKREIVGPLIQRNSQDTLARTREEIAALSEGLLPFERIEQEIATLAKRVERDAGPPEFPQFGRAVAAEEAPARSDAALNDIRIRIEALSGKVSEAKEAASASSQPRPGSLLHRLDGMRDQRPASSAASSQTAEPPEPTVASMVDTLAENLETASSPRANQTAIEALQADIAILSERLNRSDSTFEAIAALQKSVMDLFGQMEETRRVAEEATKAREQGEGKAAIDEALAQEVAELRGLQDQAERRSNATLSAVHATLQKVVQRLTRLDKDGLLEPRGPEAATDLGALTPDTADAPRPKSEGGIVATLLRSLHASKETSAELAAAPAPVEDHDLIEPGTGFPGRAQPQLLHDEPQLDVSEEPAATKRSDFIAAARRAAQTAQQEAEAIEARHGGLNAATPDSQERSGFEGRKRVIVLSLAALFVVAGGLVAMRQLPRPASQEIASSAAPAQMEAVKTEPATPAPVVPSIDSAAASPAKTSDTKSSDTKVAEISTVDPTAVGSIAPKTVPAMTPPPLLAMPPAPGMAPNLRVAAEAGVAGAQYELATRYAEGRLVPRDLRQAAQWYEKAALQGLAPAQYRLGSMYEKGLGVTRDLGRAKTWYQKAADAGNARAMHNLAVLTAEGTDNKPDYASAASWFRKAAELGIRDSQYNLAILLARGLGQPVNLVQSYAWFAAAAAQGDDDAAKKRDDIGGRLEAKDMAAARAIADAYKPIPLDAAANDVTPPPGGWDTAMVTPPPQGVKLSKAKTSGL